jgi:hypothetical protein
MSATSVLSPGPVHVSSIKTRLVEHDRNGLLRVLSPEELMIYSDLVLADDRRDYLLSRSVLRLTVSLYGGVIVAWTSEHQESRTVLRTPSTCRRSQAKSGSLLQRPAIGWRWRSPGHLSSRG